MKQKNIFELALLIILLTACGPTSEEIHATAQQEARIIVAKTNITEYTTKQTQDMQYLQQAIATTDVKLTLAPYMNTRTPDPNGCIDTNDASLYIGDKKCVTGIVINTYKSDNAFFIHFDDEYDSFTAVSFDYTWKDGLIGNCVRITGTIQDYKGQPQIIISNPDQVMMCE